MSTNPNPPRSFVVRGTQTGENGTDYGAWQRIVTAQTVWAAASAAEREVRGQGGPTAHACTVTDVKEAEPALAGPAPLSFYALRAANVARTAASFHPIEEWTPTDWATAMAGECGEACNVVKKMRRLQTDPRWHRAEDGSDADLRAALAEELADTVAYADLLAERCGIDLAEAVRAKFNKVSEKIGSHVRI